MPLLEHTEETHMFLGEQGDFCYETRFIDGKEQHAITGISDQGKAKISKATTITVTFPKTDPAGTPITVIDCDLIEERGRNKQVVITEWANIRYLQPFVFYGIGHIIIPDNWANIKEIGYATFAFSGLSTLPHNWGNITKISNSAFQETLIDILPEENTTLKFIDDYAFAHCKKLTKLPDYIFHIPHLGIGVFQGCSIENITTWGEMTMLPDYFLSGNSITEIPNTWGNITTIGTCALNECNLEKVPKEWGNITAINMCAFRANKIKHIPNNWKKVKEVGKCAFSFNKIEVIPKEDQDVIIRNLAFAANPIR